MSRVRANLALEQAGRGGATYLIAPFPRQTAMACACICICVCVMSLEPSHWRKIVTREASQEGLTTSLSWVETDCRSAAAWLAHPRLHNIEGSDLP